MAHRAQTGQLWARLLDYARVCRYDQSSGNSLPRTGPLPNLDGHRARPSERSSQPNDRSIPDRGPKGVSKPESQELSPSGKGLSDHHGPAISAL